MDGAGIGSPARAQHLGGLAGEGGKQHLAVDIFGKVLGKRGLARAGIAEQAEDLAAAFFQPFRYGLQGLVLLGCELHASSFTDSEQNSNLKEACGASFTSYRNGSLCSSMGCPCGVASAARCQLVCSARTAASSATPLSTRRCVRAATQASK
jgi:hypothetical protein